MENEARTKLVAAAADVFAERGFARASLEEIASRAGYTRGAFHWHFGSKDELFLEVLRSRLSSRTTRTDEVVAASGSPAGFNRRQRERSHLASDEERRAWTLLVMEFWLHAARDRVLRVEAARLKSELRDVIADQVTRLTGSSDGELPAPASLIATGLMAIEDGFALQALLDPDTVDPTDMRDFVDLVTEALTLLGKQPGRRSKRTRRR
jgi:AcrR family transcriptional regulator